MTVLTVPPLGDKQVRYPSLGEQVCAFIEAYLVHGPGDLLGVPVVLDPEKRALIYRMYEVFPKGHANAGKRRFKRVALSLRKGSAKTELAALIAAVELHPEGPVRCDGFDAKGNPVGRGVTDPYIPLVAYTEEQSDELAYGALRNLLLKSPLVNDFDIGLTRILRAGGDGKAVSLSSSPDSRDGARTTFMVMDETHRWTLPRLKQAHRTMLANLPKRPMSDPWALEVTTAPSPGEGSVAEDTMDYARQVADGVLTDSRLFYFHRQAGDQHKLDTPAGLRAAVIEASGPVAEWSDIDGIVDQWKDPTADKAYLERVWLNRVVRASERAFDIERWKALADKGYTPPPKAVITVGFDGARWHDATALVCTEVLTGYQWLAGLWEEPLDATEWEVPAELVDGVVAEIFRRWTVWRMYCDPPYWESSVSEWAGKYGDKVVVEWWTSRWKPMAYAVRGFTSAITAGDIVHDGSPHLQRHLGNAVKRELAQRDDEGKPLWTIYKERPDSPHKIDAGMAAILSWEARTDAIAAGVGVRKLSAYEKRGLVVAGR